MPHVAYGNTSRFRVPAVDPLFNTDNNVHPKARKLHLRYLNAMDHENMAGHFMPPAAGRPGYKILNGKDTDETIAIAESLGLTEYHVDKTRNRIAVGGHVLAYIPLEEYWLRMKERRQAADDARNSFHDRIKEQLDEVPGAKGVTIQYGDFMDRKKHGERAGKPFAAIEAWNVD